MTQDKRTLYDPETGEVLTTPASKRKVSVIAALVATLVTAIWEALPVPQMVGELVGSIF